MILIGYLINILVIYGFLFFEVSYFNISFFIWESNELFYFIFIRMIVF